MALLSDRPPTSPVGLAQVGHEESADRVPRRPVFVEVCWFTARPCGRAAFFCPPTCRRCDTHLVAVADSALSEGLVRDQSRATMPSTRKEPPPEEACHQMRSTATLGRVLAHE